MKFIKKNFNTIFLLISIYVFFINSKIIGIAMFLYYIWKLSNSTKKVKITTTIVILVVPTIIILLSLGVFSYRNFAITGNSMSPSLNKDALIFVKKIDPENLKRGDIVVFDSPWNDDVEIIRRVFGLPGDVVKVSSGSVYLNNELFRKYDPKKSTEIIQDNEKIIPQNSVFVLSDNLQHGTDSRNWGVVPFSSINYIYVYCYYKCSEN